GIPAGSYQLVLSSSATATSPGLPAGYGHTGEGTGTTADGSIDGTISLTVSAAATDRNFGIKKMLQAHNKAYVMSSSATTAINLPSSANGALRYRYLVAPAGTASSGNTPGAPTGTDPYTGTGATASDVLVIDPASYSGARNGNPVAGALVLRYKGVQLQAGGCAGTDAGGISCSLYNSATGKWEIAQFDAAQLEILVTEGVSSVGFAYAWKDAAGLISESAGYTVSFGGVLPLKLGAFTAEASAAGVLLRWNTLEEEGTDRFEVEYSTDGRAFRPAGSVAAAGTAASYRFTHRPATAGTHFYRLRMIDADGQFTWSPVRFVSDRAAAAAFTLSPNPATGSTVRLLWSGAAAQVRVTDALGRPVFATALAPGSPLGLPAGRWARGTYFVIVEGSGARYTQTLLVP
ncbi:MAG: T9SS type A sorting domain-containing protein, partial [Chitinophagaceae bacterium]